ncbi:MAG: UDP-N-acetylglucosamine-1-phosphate transferase [Candidatus Altiarchaeota archaeon]
MNTIRAVLRPLMTELGINPPVSFIIFAISMMVTVYITPKVIKKLCKEHHLVKDHYKNGEVRIPTGGGIAMIGGILGSMVMTILLFPNVADLLIFYFIVLSYGMFGVGDDLLNISQKSKIFLPFFLALPIALLNSDTSPWLIFGEVELGLGWNYILAPLYIVVAANLINMHSGFNGLCTGMSSIILWFIAIKAYLVHGVDSLFYIAPVLGAAVAFWLFDRHPSKIFMGNSGSMILGSAIGGLIVLNNIEVFGLILLFPHIINFLLYIYWRVFSNTPLQKFGSVRHDNTVEAPNPFTLKWIAPYYFRLTERQSVFVMYAVTVIFGIIALLFTWPIKTWFR